MNNESESVEKPVARCSNAFEPSVIFVVGVNVEEFHAVTNPSPRRHVELNFLVEIVVRHGSENDSSTVGGVLTPNLKYVGNESVIVVIKDELEFVRYFVPLKPVTPVDQTWNESDDYFATEEFGCLAHGNPATGVAKSVRPFWVVVLNGERVVKSGKSLRLVGQILVGSCRRRRVRHTDCWEF